MCSDYIEINGIYTKWCFVDSFFLPMILTALAKDLRPFTKWKIQNVQHKKKISKKHFFLKNILTRWPTFSL